MMMMMMMMNMTMSDRRQVSCQSPQPMTSRKPNCRKRCRMFSYVIRSTPSCGTDLSHTIHCVVRFFATGSPL